MKDGWMKTETGLGQISCTEASMHQLTLPKILLTILTSKRIIYQMLLHVYLYDYGAVIPTQTSNDNNANISHKIVTYALEHGKGRVIMIGIYGQRLLHNVAFLRFFDSIIFPHAVGSQYLARNATLPFNYFLKSGNLSDAEVEMGHYLILNFNRTKNASDMLFLSIPKSLFSDSQIQNLNNQSISVDGNKIQYNYFLGLSDLGITIPILPNSKQVKIKL